MPMAAPVGIRRTGSRPRASLTSLLQDGSSIRTASHTPTGHREGLSVGGQNFQQFRRRGKCEKLEFPPGLQKERLAVSATVGNGDAAEESRNGRRAVSAPSQRSVLNRSIGAVPRPAGSAVSAIRALVPTDVGRGAPATLHVLEVPSPGASLEQSEFLSESEVELVETQTAGSAAAVQAPGSPTPLQQDELSSEADARDAETQLLRGVARRTEALNGVSCSADAVLQRHGYASVKRLGKGSFGTAVLVQGAHGFCVCKMIDLRDASSKDQKDALKEGEVLAKLKHPYIVRHLESFVASGWMCIVMCHCAGGSLAGQISQACRSRQRLLEDQVLIWFTQALLALKYIHKKHLLHRDLKPDNLFLKSDGTLQMGDFGTCKVLACTVACAKTQVGTPYYISPEVCEGKPYGWQSDMWSMGCILFELCSLKLPFDAPSISCLVKKICRESAPQLPFCQWTAEVRELVGELLAKDPAIRPSAADVLTRPKIQSSIERLYAAVQVVQDSSGSAGDGTNLAEPQHRVTLPALARPCLHPSAAGTRATEPVRRLCRQAAETISRTMTESSSHGEAVARATMRSDEEEGMRQLYLQCIESNPDVILSEIALPLKEKLMQTDRGARLLQGPCRTVTVAAAGVAVDIDKEAFSVGRYAICDVSLLKCRDISRMQMWVFNLPGGIVVVDGWSLTGSAVQAREQAGETLARSEPGSRRAFVVPHDEAVILKLGGQVVSLNPKACIVCLDRPRAVQLGCGHRALCGRCAAAASECPLCKQAVNPSALRDSIGACVGSTFAGAQPDLALACAA